MICICLSPHTASLQKQSPHASKVSVYSGTTPCSKGKNILLIVPADADCESMKLELTLFYAPDNGHPSTYKLICQYSADGNNSTSTARAPKKVEMNGKWIITKGIKTNPTAVVYQLTNDKQGDNVLLLKLTDDLLHVLDSDRKLMIGNPGWSYTLNKVSKAK